MLLQIFLLLNTTAVLPDWYHDDVIKWKHFPRYWPFVRRIHRSPGEFPAQRPIWRGTLMFSLICVWINDWVNSGEAGDLRRYRIHYNVTVMWISGPMQSPWKQWDLKAIGVSWLCYYEQHNTAVTKWLSFCRRQLSSKRIFVNEIYLNANENFDDICSYGSSWYHCTDVTMSILASWIHCFLYPFDQTNIKENIKVCVTGLF